MLWSVGGRVDSVVLGCASAGKVIARREATAQAANRQRTRAFSRLCQALGASAINPPSAGWFQLSAFLLLQQPLVGGFS
jgi:hypothetical protein